MDNDFKYIYVNLVMTNKTPPTSYVLMVCQQFKVDVCDKSNLGKFMRLIYWCLLSQRGITYKLNRNN